MTTLTIITIIYSVGLIIGLISMGFIENTMRKRDREAGHHTIKWFFIIIWPVFLAFLMIFLPLQFIYSIGGFISDRLNKPNNTDIENMFTIYREHVHNTGSDVAVGPPSVIDYDVSAPPVIADKTYAEEDKYLAENDYSIRMNQIFTCRVTGGRHTLGLRVEDGEAMISCITCSRGVTAYIYGSLDIMQRKINEGKLILI